MKKSWSIPLSVLLGAAVVGLGTGYFLHLANQDRERLAYEAQQAKSAAEQALADRQKAVDEANQKLAQANQEVSKAQSTLLDLQRERELLAKARPLSMAGRSQSWPSVVSTGMGLSLRIPNGSRVSANDIYGLSISASGTSATASASSSEPWLSITPYDALMKQQFEARLASTTQAVFFVNGKLISGVSGNVIKANSTYPVAGACLSLITEGTSTQLVWIQDPPRAEGKPKKNSVLDSWLDVLATLDFKK